MRTAQAPFSAPTVVGLFFSWKLYKIPTLESQRPMLGKNRKIILSVTRRLLRPIAALCVAQGIKIREVTELLKRAFIDAAEDELKRRELEKTTSKLSAMTGLQRKDIVRLGSVEEEPQTFDLIARIVGQWTSNKRFQTETGRPKRLFLEGKEGSFWTLVESVSTDLNPYTVLFELERAGVAERDETGWIQLSRSIPSIEGHAVDGLNLLAEDHSDLLGAVYENLFDRQDVPNLHIRTYFDNLCPEDEAKVRRWLLDKGTEWQREVRDYLSRFDKDINHKLADRPGGMRAVFGTFSLVRPSTPRPPAERSAKKTRRKR